MIDDFFDYVLGDFLLSRHLATMNVIFIYQSPKKYPMHQLAKITIAFAQLWTIFKRTINKMFESMPFTSIWIWHSDWFDNTCSLYDNIRYIQYGNTVICSFRYCQHEYVEYGNTYEYELHELSNESICLNWNSN